MSGCSQDSKNRVGIRWVAPGAKYPWSVVGFGKRYLTQTPEKFKVEYSLEGEIRRDESVKDLPIETSAAAAHEALDALVDRYNTEVITPIFRSSAFLALGFASKVKLKDGSVMTHPKVCAYRATVADGKTTYPFDPNGTATVAEANATPFKRNGCSIHLNCLRYGVWQPHLLEENFKMLKSEIVDHIIKEDTDYRAAREYAAAAAMKALHDLEGQFINEFEVRRHGCEQFTVMHRVVYDRVEIRWHIHGGLEKQGFRIHGTRFTGGLGRGEMVEVANSGGDDTIAERLTRGQNYYYNFVLRGRPRTSIFSTEPGPPDEFGPVTFSVPVPTAEEIQHHKQRVARLINPPSPASAQHMHPEEEQMRDRINMVRAKLRSLKAYTAFVREAEAEFRNSPEYKNATAEERTVLEAEFRILTDLNEMRVTI